MADGRHSHKAEGPASYEVGHRHFLTNLLKTHGPQTREQILEAAKKDGRHTAEFGDLLDRMREMGDLKTEDPPGGGAKVYRLP